MKLDNRGVDLEERRVEYKKTLIVSYPEFPCHYYPSGHIGLHSEFTFIVVNRFLLFSTQCMVSSVLGPRHQ